MRGHGARPVPARTRAAYFDYLKKRHPDDLAQQVVEVPGVGHDGLGMFTSACGLAVLFGQALPQSCPVVAGTAPDMRSAGH